MKTVVLGSGIGALVYMKLYCLRYKKYPILLTSKEVKSPFFNIIDDWTYNFLIKIFPGCQNYFQLFELECIFGSKKTKKLVRLLLPGLRNFIISDIGAEIITYTSLDEFEEKHILYDKDKLVDFDELIIANGFNKKYITETSVSEYNYTCRFYTLKNTVNLEENELVNFIYPDNQSEWLIGNIKGVTHIGICSNTITGEDTIMKDLESYIDEPIDIDTIEYDIHQKASLHEPRYKTYELIASSKGEAPITLSLGNYIAVMDCVNLITKGPLIKNIKRKGFYDFLQEMNTENNLPDLSKAYEYFHKYLSL